MMFLGSILFLWVFVCVLDKFMWEILSNECSHIVFGLLKLLGMLGKTFFMLLFNT